jgi:hypothetical protein
MKSLIKSLVVCGALGAIANLNAQTTINLNPSDAWIGYMNWSPAPGNAAGYGGSGSSAWGTADLPASFSGSMLTLSPNTGTYNAADPYWVNADGSGANIMDANFYVETTGTYVDQNLTFTADVLSYSLVNPYTSIAFIKDFAPDYSSSVSTTVALTPGVFSISLLTSANPGDHIQYGFETFGPDANPDTVASLGNVTIAPVPEPTTLALAGLGGAAILSLIRRRKS